MCCESVVIQLDNSIMYTFNEVENVPPDPGVYVIWLVRPDGKRKVLKIGCARTSEGQGLRGKLRQEKESRLDRQALTYRLEKDTKLARKYKTNLKDRKQRREFILRHCRLMFVVLWTENIVDQTEEHLREKLKPVYR